MLPERPPRSRLEFATDQLQAAAVQSAHLGGRVDLDALIVFGGQVVKVLQCERAAYGPVAAGGAVGVAKQDESGDPVEPAPERVSRAVAAEVGEANGHGLEHLLDDVLSIRPRDSPAARPIVTSEFARREADGQRVEADRQREVVRAAREVTRRNLYAAQMGLALQSWTEHRGRDRMAALLNRWLPAAGERDLRGWEWFYLDGLLHPKATVFPFADITSTEPG